MASTLKKPVSRRANTPLNGSFGADKNRRIIITLIPGHPDLIQLRPERTRRTETISVEAAYRMAVQWRVNGEKRRKAKDREEKKQARKAARYQNQNS